MTLMGICSTHNCGSKIYYCMNKKRYMYWSMLMYRVIGRNIGCPYEDILYETRWMILAYLVAGYYDIAYDDVEIIKINIDGDGCKHDDKIM